MRKGQAVSDQGNAMKAIVYHKYGSSDVLALQEIDKPVVDDDGVLIRVHAAAVNAADWHLMRGQPYFMRLMGSGLVKRKKHVAGMDVAGNVEAVGKNVTQLQAGDEVYGVSDGAFAEYACAP
jgi:NADPH:quinone reductase-like Zn-dependent oxidoreductase